MDNIREDSQRCFYTNFGMRKEKKTRREKLEKHEAETCPMIIGKVTNSMPKMKTVKLKEKMNTSNSRSDMVTTCETSGNIMRLFVNLMPVLAAAKEPEEEEENSCTSKEEPETSCKTDPSVTEPVEQTLKSSTGGSLSHRFVLPPITQHKPAPDRGQKRCHTPLPPISSSNQTRSISSKVSVKGSEGDGSVTGPEADSRPWIENPLFSKSVSKLQNKLNFSSPLKTDHISLKS